MLASQKRSGRSRPRMQAFADDSTAKSIRTWRLDPDGQNGTFADYTIDAPGKIIAGKVSASLRRLVLANADAATRHDEKFHFDPGILLRFQSGKDEVQVAICFICNKWALYLNGETVSYTSIEEERRAVLAEVKAIFPNDKIIQGIPKNCNENHPDTGGPRSDGAKRLGAPEHCLDHGRRRWLRTDRGLRRRTLEVAAHRCAGQERYAV